jgi:hypothetical protein
MSTPCADLALLYVLDAMGVGWDRAREAIRHFRADRPGLAAMAATRTPLLANVVLTAIGHNLRLVLAWLPDLSPPCEAIALAPAFRWAS